MSLRDDRGLAPQSIHNRGTQLRSRPLPTNRHTAQKHNASTGPTRKNGIPRSSSHPHFPDWTIHPFSLHCPWKRSRAWIPRPPPTHSYPATIPTKKTWRNGGNCTVRTNSLLRSDRFRRQACTPTPSHHSPQQFQQHTNRIHSHAKEGKDEQLAYETQSPVTPTKQSEQQCRIQRNRIPEYDNALSKHDSQHPNSHNHAHTSTAIP